MKQVKGILIDPITQTISQHEVDADDYREIYRMIDADTFDAVRIDDINVAYVDDEGLLKDPKYFWQWVTPSGRKYSEIAGKAFILGSDENGSTVGTTLTVEEVNARVTFFTGRVGRYVPIPAGAKMNHPILGEVNVVGGQHEIERDE